MKGEDLTPDLIRRVYEAGAFPMGDENEDVEFYFSPMRALFPIEGIHVSNSLQKVIKRQFFEIKFNTSFREVMTKCRRPDGNWITPGLIESYTKVHEQGWAHCAECWRNGELVGGIYGLAIGTVFSAESMFHREVNASKVALWAMVEKCREQGFEVFDAQIMNPHLASLGAYEITHNEFLELLNSGLQRTIIWQ